MDQNTISRKTELDFASPFSHPVSAIFGGETVRITHVGNAQGMSPVYLVVDGQGQSAWVPQRDVKIIDQNFLPLGQESLDLLSSLSGGGGSTGSSRNSGSSTRSPQAVG